MKVVLLNVGSNSNNSCGRGPIFGNGSFKFVPIEEGCKYKKGTKIDTHRTLGLEKRVPSELADTPVHNDPDFLKFTYGHIMRGWGDIKKLKSLSKDDILLFMTTLDFKHTGMSRLKWINPSWGAYIVGYFEIDYILTDEEFWASSENVKKDFEDCPHFKRVEAGSDLWIKGTNNSKLLDMAIPLSDARKSVEPNDIMKKFFLYDSKSGGWYRRVFSIEYDKSIEEMIGEFKPKALSI